MENKKQNSKFVHLHVHTEYSLLDGLSKTNKLLEYVGQLGMDAVAITDHGAMYGVVEFYKNAKILNIKPIIGIETYITNVPLENINDRQKSTSNHLLLLAKSEKGYKNLMKLSSIAHLKGYYYRPRIDRAMLKKYSNDLICTSSCPQGEIPQALIDDDYNMAKKMAEWYLDIFADDFYFEVQRHNYSNFLSGINNPVIKDEIIKMADNENKIIDGIIKLSGELGVPIVATNDSHYLKREDATAQDALVCIATGKNVSDVKRLRFIDTPSFEITSPSVMADRFKDLPEALQNSVRISEKCNVELSTLGKWFFPKFTLTDKSCDSDYLKKLVYKRLPKKINIINDSVKERLEHELEIIINKGYSSYFLIVMDMVNWANEQGIITNTRGSAAGSLVSYVLGITTVNPLQYYLPFERFLNPFRPSPPDIDFDVADARREEVLDYISKTYGNDKVAQICTFGRMLSRTSVRDVARVLGYPYGVGDKIAKLIPPPKQGFPITIPKALESTSELRNLYDYDKDAKKILDLSMQIEGNARHISVHAAGVVVSPTSLTDFTPIQREPSGDKIITQYEFHTCEDVGLIKFDILGIRNLTILGESLRLLKENENIELDIHNIPIKDKNTFKMLGKGDTMGTFQLSSSGMTKYLKDLKPTKVEDLMAMVALYRPGPIDVIPEYIRRKKNPKLVKYLDPRMKKFLKASYGLIVYQDDLLFCAIELVGYTWEEADKFRKAVGKKIPEEMAAQKEKFTTGIVKNGQTKTFADNLWKLFEPFQAYGFNKAHAASYGMVAYQTAYMKANYPVEFMCALLSAESADKDKISMAVNECRRMKIKVLPPDINESDEGFKIVKYKDSYDRKAIRFGLNAIKNVGRAAIDAIIMAKGKKSFLSYYDFLVRVDARRVNKKVLESLIKVGALSMFGSRAQLLATMDQVKEKASRIKTDQNQQGLFSIAEMKTQSIKAEINSPETIREFEDNELHNLEKELLGFSLSSKPIHDIIGNLINSASHNISDINEEINNSIVTLAAVIKEVRIIITKKSGEEMAFVKVEDETGIISTILFPSIYRENKDKLNENNPILISGKVNMRDDEISIIVDNINSTFESGDVYIKIPKDVDKQVLLKLKMYLELNKGENNAFIVFEKNNRKLPLPFKINWNKDIAQEIAGILNINYGS